MTTLHQSIDNFSNYFPWYSKDHSLLLNSLEFCHSGSIPELFVKNKQELSYTEIPTKQFTIATKNKLNLLYQDDFTHILTDSSNSVYFNKGNPFINILYDNTIFDMTFEENIYEILRFGNYLQIVTFLPHLKIYQTNLEENSDSLFKNFQAFDFDIKIKYTATSLKVKTLGYDLQMNSLTGLLHNPDKNSSLPISTFWNPLISNNAKITEIEQPGFLGFIINIKPNIILSIGINPSTKEIQIRHQKTDKSVWFLHQEFDDTIFSDKNRLYTCNPVKGLVQFSKDSQNIKDYAGAYWSEMKITKRIYENEKLQLEFDIKRNGSNTLIFDQPVQSRIKFFLPKHLNDMTITGMGFIGDIINSKMLGNLKGYEIDSDVVTFEKQISPPELFPNTSDFTCNDKKRLASRIIHSASNYNINYINSISSLSGLLCLGVRLLLLGKSLRLDLTQSHFKDVIDKIRDTLKYLLINRLSEIVDSDFGGGVIYSIASMEYLNLGVYSDHKNSVNILLNARFNDLENLFTCFYINSSAGFKITESFASSFLARTINDPRHTTFIASALLRGIAFNDYIVLPDGGGQELNHFEGIAGPVVMTKFGLKLATLFSLIPESLPARYCGVLEQQIGTCVQEITPKFVTTEWVHRLQNNPADFRLDVENIKNLLSENNLISVGPYSKVVDTSHLGVSCLRLITLDADTDMEFFSASWKRILEIQLDSDFDISSSSYNTVSLLYWLTKNHKVDSLDYDCLQFFINCTSSCDKPPVDCDDYIEQVGYNISLLESRRDAIQIRVNLNSLDNDMSTVEARVTCKDISICFKVNGIRKIVKGEGSLRQKAEALGVSAKALIIYAAAFLTLYVLSSGKRNIGSASLCKYLTSEKFFDAYNIISCSFYSKYLGFVDNSGFNNYFI